MSKAEMVKVFEQVQREGRGDELLTVTPEQAERLQALVEGQQAFQRAATALPRDGRLVLVRG